MIKAEWEEYVSLRLRRAVNLIDRESNRESN